MRRPLTGFKKIRFKSLKTATIHLNTGIKVMKLPQEESRKTSPIPSQTRRPKTSKRGYKGWEKREATETTSILKLLKCSTSPSWTSRKTRSLNKLPEWAPRSFTVEWNQKWRATEGRLREQRKLQLTLITSELKRLSTKNAIKTNRFLPTQEPQLNHR